VDNVTLPQGNGQIQAVWSDAAQPIIQVQDSSEGWSVGWRWHLSQQFEPEQLERWLGGLNWRRAKLVIHSPAGWQSANALDRQPLCWQPSEWRRDSRLELIFAGPQDLDSLQVGMDECRVRPCG
jgi:hypothetical protein